MFVIVKELDMQEDQWVMKCEKVAGSQMFLKCCLYEPQKNPQHSTFG